VDPVRELSQLGDRLPQLALGLVKKRELPLVIRSESAA